MSMKIYFIIKNDENSLQKYGHERDKFWRIQCDNRFIYKSFQIKLLHLLKVD
jgi:hypothetical protein